MDEASIYKIIGEDGFRRLVAGFYGQVPEDDILGRMYPAKELAAAEQRLRDFLIYRFGVPSDISKSAGILDCGRDIFRFRSIRLPAIVGWS